MDLLPRCSNAVKDARGAWKKGSLDVTKCQVEKRGSCLLHRGSTRGAHWWLGPCSRPEKQQAAPREAPTDPEYPGRNTPSAMLTVHWGRMRCAAGESPGKSSKGPSKADSSMSSQRSRISWEEPTVPSLTQTHGYNPQHQSAQPVCKFGQRQGVASVALTALQCWPCGKALAKGVL